MKWLIAILWCLGTCFVSAQVDRIEGLGSPAAVLRKVRDQLMSLRVSISQETGGKTNATIASLIFPLTSEVDINALAKETLKSFVTTNTFSSGRYIFTVFCFGTRANVWWESPWMEPPFPETATDVQVDFLRSGLKIPYDIRQTFGTSFSWFELFVDGQLIQEACGDSGFREWICTTTLFLPVELATGVSTSTSVILRSYHFGPDPFLKQSDPEFFRRTVEYDLKTGNRIFRPPQMQIRMRTRTIVSPPPLPFRTEKRPFITVARETGRAVAIERSQQPTGPWITITNFPSAGNAELEDQALAEGAVFYRARETPP
jgi:hypothetical protein